MIINSTNGYEIIVSRKDYKVLKSFEWYVSKIGNQHYVTRFENYRNIYMHRQIMEFPKGMVVDHRNGNGLDNTRRNLRICSIADNVRNCKTVRRNNKSGYRGVSVHKSGKWQSAIMVNRRSIKLGICDNPADAAKLYDKAAKKYFGRFAKTNF